MARQVAKFVNPVFVALKRLGGSARPKEVCAVVAHDMGLEGSPVLEKTLKSGASRFENKIAWVRQYFVWAGIIDVPNAEYGPDREGSQYQAVLR